jgi:hypothetical protein
MRSFVAAPTHPCDKKPQAGALRLLDYLRPMFSLQPLRFLPATCLFVTLWAACSSPPYPVTKTCDSIGEACHEFDHGTEGPAHDCHLAAHTGDEAVCVQKLTTCMAVCKQPSPLDGGIDAAGTSSVETTDADPGADAAGSGDGPAGNGADTGVAAADGGSADAGACIAYCACMTKQCSQPAEAPAWTKDPTMCLAKCATFSAQQRSCWSSFCDVNAATVPVHNCVHAWGGHGLDECQ